MVRSRLTRSENRLRLFWGTKLCCASAPIVIIVSIIRAVMEYIYRHAKLLPEINGAKYSRIRTVTAL